MDEFFNLAGMMNNYEERLIKNTRTEKFTVDTVLVTVRHMPYETAIKHVGFRNGNWIVLGWRETREGAKKFHDEIVEFYKTHDVDSITDVFEEKTFRRKG